MDMHITAEEMDLARQMGDSGLKWPFGVGDYFCTESDELHICLDIQRDADGQAWLSDNLQGRLPAVKAYWLPKRYQCMEWLSERGWLVKVGESGQTWAAQLSHPRARAVSAIEGFGPTELASLYSAIGQMLEWKIEGMAL